MCDSSAVNFLWYLLLIDFFQSTCTAQLLTLRSAMRRNQFARNVKITISHVLTFKLILSKEARQLFNLC